MKASRYLSHTNLKAHVIGEMNWLITFVFCNPVDDSDLKHQESLSWHIEPFSGQFEINRWNIMHCNTIQYL